MKVHAGAADEKYLKFGASDRTGIRLPNMFDSTPAWAHMHLAGICEHTWISLHAQRDMFIRKRGAHLDLSPVQRVKHVFMRHDWLLRSHAASTLPCAMKHVHAKRLQRSRAAPKIDDFPLPTPVLVSKAKFSGPCIPKLGHCCT